ncbi:MAG: hypothetical protein JRJ57_12090, partial [Deltaproteobacteria bacterium]|nr:hypothetical protein [Deltaproteobacteria bacterium]
NETPGLKRPREQGNCFTTGGKYHPGSSLHRPNGTSQERGIYLASPVIAAASAILGSIGGLVEYIKKKRLVEQWL